MGILTLVKALVILLAFFLVFLWRNKGSGAYFPLILKCISLYFIAVYIVIVGFRILYPFQLSIWEGATLDQCRRILSGHVIFYSKPSLTFTPYLYTPLYYYLSSLFMKLLGIGFLAPRLISFLSSLACFALIYFMVKKETQERLYGLLAAGIFAATFGTDTNFLSWIWASFFTSPTEYNLEVGYGGWLDPNYRYLDSGYGGWLDTANVDSLFLLLVLSCFFIVRNSRDFYGPVSAAIFLAAAFFTKQPAIFIAPFIALFYFIEDRKQFVSFSAVFVALFSSLLLLFAKKTDGWFLYYVYHKYKQLYLSITPSLRDRFLFTDILAPLPVVCFIITLFLLLNYKHLFSRNSHGTKNRFCILTSLGVFTASWFGRSHCGGDNNLLLPTYAMFSVVFAIGCQTIIRLMSAKNTANPVRLLLYAFLATQYVVLFYNPASRIPDTRDKQAGEHLLKTIKSYSGDVFIPFHNYLAALAGKKTYAHGPGLLIVLGRGGGTFNSTKPAQDLRREIDESITCKRFDAVMSDEYPYLFQNTRHVRENEEWFLLINKDLLDRCYEPAGKAFSEDHVTFFPTTGWFIRPSIIYVPRKSES